MSVGIGVGANLAHVLAVPLVGVPNTVPVVSDVVVTDTTATTATITWTTQIPASSQVRFGTTTLYGQETDVADTAPPVTAHGVIVTGLIEGTDYNFQAVSRNAFGTPGVSANGTFTTDDVTAPVVSNAAASETRRAVAVALGGAKITGTFDTVFEAASTWWVVSENADMSSPVLTTSEIDTSPRKTTGHSQEMTGLLPEKHYYCQPHAKDAAGNEGVGAVVEVTTIWTPIEDPDLVGWYELDLESVADGSTTQTPTDWSNAAPGTVTQAGATARPLVDLDGANGKPEWFFDDVNDRWETTTDLADRDFTGDCTQVVGFRHTATGARDVIWSHADVTTNTRRYDFGIQSTGAFYVFNDGKGSDQNTTATNFGTDGLNHMVVIRRSGTTTTISADGTDDINTFTGMSSTNPTGGSRIGTHTSGANPYGGGLQLLLFFKNAMTSTRRAKLWAYTNPRHFAVPDTTAPVITNTVVAETKVAEGINGAELTITFDTALEAGSTQAQTDANPDFSTAATTGEIDTSPRKTTGHSQAITGLSAYTTYSVRGRSRDAATNLGVGSAVGITTSWTPVVFGADCVLWIDSWLAYHVTGRAEGATNDPLDWSGAGHTFTSLAKPSFLRFGMNGAPCWDFVEGDTDHWDEADVLDLDLTGACFIGLVYRADTPVTNPTPLIVHGNTTPFAVQWGLQLATDGTIQFVTSGGGTQSSTSTQFSGPDEGGVVIPNVAVAINRDALGNAQLYANGAAHDLFTGATSGNATGPIRFGINAAGTVHGTFKLAHALVVNRQIDAGELANWWGYVG